MSHRAAPTERGFERVVLFSDAVVAIAITLLILPVVDAAVPGQRSARSSKRPTQGSSRSSSASP